MMAVNENSTLSAKRQNREAVACRLVSSAASLQSSVAFQAARNERGIFIAHAAQGIRR